MSEYITKLQVQEIMQRHYPYANLREETAMYHVNKDIKALPAADVVLKTTYEQAVWERDICLEQLAAIGKGLGQKMDDVAPVVHGEWIAEDASTERCSVCEHRFYISALFAVGGNDEPPCCPNCGAKMDGGAEP